MMETEFVEQLDQEDEQRSYFQSFGFIKLENVIGTSLLDALVDEYERNIVNIAKVYRRPVGVRGQMSWSNLNMESLVSCSIFETGLLPQIAERLLGRKPIGLMANGNHFSGQFTEWHADTSIECVTGIKFVAYLEDLTINTGALRFMPGSHFAPFHLTMKRYGEKAELLQPGNPDAGAVVAKHRISPPGFACETKPGDVIAFDLRTWHASFGGANRRMCSFTYLADPIRDEDYVATKLFARQLKAEAMNREIRRRREWEAGSDSSAISQAYPQYAKDWLAAAAGTHDRQAWSERMRVLGLL